MNPQTIIIMLVAGVTSVVSLAVVVSGSFLAFPFLILSALPIAIAGLGWGSIAGLGAGLVGALGIFLLSHPQTALLYAILVAFPVAYLSHLIGLSRQDDPNGPEEWFPLGDVLFRAALIGGIVMGGAFIVSNFNIENMTNAALVVFKPVFDQVDQTNVDALKRAIALQVRLTPFSSPAAWLIAIWFNLWLAIKVVRASGKLNRPHFQLSTSDMPRMTMGVLAVGLMISLFTAEPLAHAGSALVGALGMALLMMGCVTMHVITRKNSLRGLILAMVYSGILFFGFPALILAGLGLADLILKIRQRFLAANPV